MSPMALAELLCAVFVAIVLVGEFDKSDKLTSAKWLKVTVVVTLAFLLVDVSAYTFVGPSYPLAFRYVINLLAFMGGPVALIFFTKYCEAYIGERTTLNPWIFRIPIIFLIVDVIAIAINFFAGSFVVYQDGIEVAVNNYPIYLRVLAIIPMIYNPIVVFVKRKSLGTRAVILLGFFNIAPILSAISAIFTGVDIGTVFGAFSLVLVSTLLQKSEKRLRLEKSNRELKEALDAAELTEQRIDVLIDSMGGSKWYYEIDANDEVVAAHYADQTKRQFGSQNPVSPMTWTQLLHPDDKEQTIEAFMAAIRDHSGKTPYDITFRVMGRDGRYHWEKSSGRLIHHADGTGELYGMNLDITEQVEGLEQQRQQLKEALSMAESANRAKTMFLNSMSHDIRTPMNAITGFTGLAQSHLDNKEQVGDYLGKIEEASDHLLSLINDVLDLSRIESGKMNLDEKPENLSDIVRALGDIVQADMQAKQHSFLVDMTDVHDQNVICDRLKLNQVLLNVLSNSIKYTPAGGNISLCLTEKAVKKSGYAVFEFCIKDNGMGMDKEFLEHIFDPFERVKSSTVSGIQGTGLGMAITKSVVDMMGGRIEVESELGKGTETRITLDFKLVDESAMAVESAASKPAPVEYDFSGKRILLVEDNELNREIACEILQEDGFEVEVAEDGSVAVERMRAAQPGDYDLILMDVQMPVMNGHEATRQIRALGTEIARIPIIAMTANAFEEDRKAALAAGMDEHIAKPIDIGKLKETLARFL